MKRWVRPLRRGLLGLGFGLLAATIVYPFVLGEDAGYGKVEDGRYFVGSTGNRFYEVSEAAWRYERFLEWGAPWLPVLLIWAGLALASRSTGEQRVQTSQEVKDWQRRIGLCTGSESMKHVDAEGEAIREAEPKAAHEKDPE